MRWSENETCQFVKMYLNHAYLWDREHEHYKLRDKRMRAYRDIIAEFRAATGIALTIADVKVKIKNLRSTYAQELVKIRNRSSDEYTYAPTIKWFAHMHQRLRHHMRAPAALAANDISEDSLERDTSKIWVMKDSRASSEEAEAEEDLLTIHNDYIFLPKSEPEDTPDKSSRISNSYKMNRSKTMEHNSSTASEGTYRGSMESLESSKSDEFDLYGKYIASQLRTMNLKKVLRLQLEIQSLISEARISDL